MSLEEHVFIGNWTMPGRCLMKCLREILCRGQDVALGERMLGLHWGVWTEECNMLMVNSLVDMFMKFGDTSAAKCLFDECVDKNLVLYCRDLSNYVRQRLAGEVISVMGDMLQQGLRPDKVTILSAISALAQLSNSLTGKYCMFMF
ncbi:hypothetical protein RchiOBHm_Chr4g0389241 [Rosa chinensis]|uniref:Pentatricopeptide n=1 Tax=Rosa chinensis TaxID=74649 RepID=A0A2P6QPX8_ROSCH|nr:hypothetical protein RchiOBHm_Chr4g0389241 [Rosa chinensis]